MALELCVPIFGSLLRRAKCFRHHVSGEKELEVDLRLRSRPSSGGTAVEGCVLTAARGMCPCDQCRNFAVSCLLLLQTQGQSYQTYLQNCLFNSSSKKNRFQCLFLTCDINYFLCILLLYSLKHSSTGGSRRSEGSVAGSVRETPAR